jgi:hypothetical protein
MLVSCTDSIHVGAALNELDIMSADGSIHHVTNESRQFVEMNLVQNIKEELLLLIKHYTI